MINRYDYESAFDAEADRDLVVAMNECRDPQQLKHLERSARQRLSQRARETRALERAFNGRRRGLSRLLTLRSH